MKLITKEKTVTSYRLKLSDDEAQELLSDIVDALHSIDRHTPLNAEAMLPALTQLKLRLQGF